VRRGTDMRRIYVTDLKPGDEFSDGQDVHTVVKTQPACSDKPRQTFVTTDKGDLIEYVVSRTVIVTN